VKVIIEFDLKDWESFKDLIEYLMGDEGSFVLRTVGDLEISELKKKKEAKPT